MSSQGHPVRTRSRWRRAFGGFAVFALFAGMLFWTKLRLVSEIPRSAYADPPAKMVDPEQVDPDQVDANQGEPAVQDDTEPDEPTESDTEDRDQTELDSDG